MRVTGYYETDGMRISLRDWSDHFEGRRQDVTAEKWWRTLTRINADQTVSTVRLGIDFLLDGGESLWETMVSAVPTTTATRAPGVTRRARSCRMTTKRIVSQPRAGEPLMTSS